MPPNSRMTAWHPIRMPAVTDPSNPFFNLQTQIMSTEGGTETLALSDIGAMQFDQSFRILPDEPVTAIMDNPGTANLPSKLWANTMDLLLTARFKRGLSNNLVIYGEHLAPAGEETLGVLDHLVLSDDRIATDAAGIGAIRRWVVGGGRLWVLADRVSPDVLNALLGDENALTVVDRVEITHLNLVAAPGVFVSAPFERDLDQPVPLVRVIAEGIQPEFTVDGWPAAFWKSSGEGRILVTTLGANGWLREKRAGDPNAGAGSGISTGFYPSEPLSQLAAAFFVRRPAPALPRALAEEQVRDIIGYTIPSRGLVLGTLLGFTALISAGGFWLNRNGRLEYLGLATPVAAFLAGGLLLFTSLQARSEIPHATAAIQLVQAVPGTDDIRAVGVTGQFSQGESETATIAGEKGGWGMPDMSGLEGSLRRIVWTDLDRWSWEKLTQKPGLRTIGMQASGRLSHPLSAVAGFSTGSLSGTVQLAEGLEPADAILATASGRIGLRIDHQGAWTATDELGPNQYLVADLLSDEQQRRTRILSEMLQRNPSRPVPPVPTLYLWTKPWGAGQSFGPHALTGSALVSVPITWQAPPSGTEFTIPRALLAYREVTGPDGINPSGFYDPRAGEWVERTGAATTWVAFDLPPELLPLRTMRVEVILQVNGPMGRLELSGFRQGKRESIRVWDNPVGTLKHTIEDGSLIPIDGSGRFRFRLDPGIASALFSLDKTTDSSTEAPPPRTRGLSTEEELGVEMDAPPTYWRFEDISARITVQVP